MSLHSNSLFHFTKKEHLIGILENNFIPHYCKERLTIGNTNYDCWVPMVSFCDIPLSQVKNHIEEYGKYAIGLSREWVNKNKLNPVLYYKEESLLFENYYELRSSIQKEVKKTDCDDTLLNNYNKIKYLFSFFKPYEGYDFKLQKEKVFYTEREWRFVPETIDNDYMILNRYFNSNQDELIKDSKLIFEPKDISYIVIEKESERLAVATTIREIKGNKYSHNDVETLITKIISSEQILNDM